MELNKHEQKLLNGIISRYYHEPTRKKVKLPPIIKKHKKIKKETIPKYKEIEVDKGPSEKSYFVWIVGGIISLVLIAIKPVLGILGLILSSSIGYYLYIYDRKTEIEEISESEIIEKEVIEEEIIDQGIREEIIPNNQKIISVSKLSIPFRALQFKDRILFVGPKELSNTVEIKYPTLKAYQQVYQLFDCMNEYIQRVPYVLTRDLGHYKLAEDSSYGNEIPLRGFEKRMNDDYQKLTNLLKEVMYVNFRLPLADYNEFSEIIEKTSNRNNDNDEEELLTNYINSDEGIKLEEIIKDWIKEWDKKQNILNAVRFNSLTNEIETICFNLGNMINYSAFNFYCPHCNEKNVFQLLFRDYSLQAEEINEPVYFSENTQCFFNSNNETWICKTCEQETSEPIPIHKTLDEILLPTFDKLINENKNERLKEHTQTKKKELEILNEMDMEIEKVNYDNLTAIYALTDEMERMKAEIFGEKEAVNSLSVVASMYNETQSKVIDSINKFSEQLQTDIERKTQLVLSEIDIMKEKEMKALDLELLEFAKAKRLEDEKRDAIQRSILEVNYAHMQVTKAGFQETNKNLSSINANVVEGNRIAGEGFNKLNNSLQEVKSVAKEGFEKVNKTIETDNKKIIEKLHKGNAIRAAIAKKEKVNLHDEGLLHIGKIVKNKMIDVTGSIIGKSTVEREGEKLNG